MSHPEFFDETALLDRLVVGALEGRRPVTFLVGSPLTAPLSPGAVGVPNVNGMIEQVREELGISGDIPSASTDNLYQEAFRALLASRGPGTVSRVVRQAVLRAAVYSPPDLLEAARDGEVVECRRACDALERNINGWGLSPGVVDLGRLVASFPRRFGQAVLTSNFDPLIEISIQRAGSSCWRTTPQGDGSLQHSRGQGCHVVHVHGYWYDTDTLHIPSHLQAERPQLRASLRRLFEGTTLVVVAYGGWDDVFSKALIDVVSDGGAFPEVIWTFHDSDEQIIRRKSQRLLDRLRPGLERAGRISLYGGVDCHTFFGKLWERLPASLELDAWEIHRSDQQGAAGYLHQIEENLSDYSGAELVDHLINSLTTFSEDFVRPKCKIGVVARSSPDEFLFRHVSEGLGTELLDQLSALSLLWGDKLRPWSKTEHLEGIEDNSLGHAGVAIPLRFPGQKLSGHLFFLHTLPFTPREIGLLLEMGRTIASLIRIERDRRLFHAVLGRFRHSLIGPIQGLLSLTSLLIKKTSDVESNSDDLRSLREKLEAEGQAIRYVIQNQRLSMAESIQITRRRGNLHDLLLQCMRRFQNAGATRGITMRLDWSIQGPLSLLCDWESLDLAISNLLDNAIKYSFFGRQINLGARIKQYHVLIWVEDVGHGIPKSLGELIFSGHREDIRDPFQTISGEGLGLVVTRKIVNAHNGRISYECRRLGSDKDPTRPTQPYLVRFTISLPLERT